MNISHTFPFTVIIQISLPERPVHTCRWQTVLCWFCRDSPRSWSVPRRAAPCQRRPLVTAFHDTGRGDEAGYSRARGMTGKTPSSSHSTPLSQTVSATHHFWCCNNNSPRILHVYPDIFCC